MVSQICENCGKRYKILEKNLCYICYKKKFGVVPTKGCYEMEKKK